MCTKKDKETKGINEVYLRSESIRTVRWLDRCISAHNRDDEQSIFPIVQGKFQEYFLWVSMEHDSFPLSCFGSRRWPSGGFT